MPLIQETELKKQISQANFAPLYVLYGQEKYVLNQAAKQLIQKAAGQDFLEFNLNEFNSQASIDKIADAAEALPLMAERKCVVVADWNPDEKNTTEVKKLHELLENLSDSTVLIFYFPTVDVGAKNPAKWKNFLKKATEKGTVIEFKPRDSAELIKRVMREAEKRNCSFTKQNAECLVEYTGSDLKALMNEVDKLCAFANENEITRTMIEQLVTKSTETTVFLLADALVGGNYEKAYKLMHQLVDGGEQPVAVLAALSSAYVDMMRVKAAVQSGLNFSAPAEYGEYRGREFRLRKAERNAKALPIEVLRESLLILLDTDIALKSSKMEAPILMDALIAKLLLCTKGEKAS
ncbi:DNA polymerase III subunit delta [Scatolibacter rhodanostii]|uniref:DNA polymerase III subunit delta n=1 Tax=Scatolibacter rhodanostii TaxID=2014781 RepID=UPI000C08AA34|nr:DNA polymerase III subunit delta [Scatolibacter rhodanostii]